MPIKINGTTVIDEANFADKNLSNLSETGLAVITNAASSVGANYMKKINTKAGVRGLIGSSGSYTTPSDGWLILQHSGSNNISITVGVADINFETGDDAFLSFPVCSGTTISRHTSSSTTETVTYIFFPEVS